MLVIVRGKLQFKLFRLADYKHKKTGKINCEG